MADQSADGAWQCQHCTVLNDMPADKCHLCGGSRDGAPPAQVSGFEVTPNTSCEHVATAIQRPGEEDVEASGRRWRGALDGPCSAPGCSETKELWLCLGCRMPYCGRYAAGHMMQHGRESGHLICTSSRDLSTWCYGCDSYLDQYAIPEVMRAYQELHVAKFGELPPDADPVITLRAGK